MSDTIDQAQDCDETNRLDALNKQRAASGLVDGDWQRVSKKWCAGWSCGLRIPDERRKALPGVELCVDCQTSKEKGQGRSR